MVLYRLKLWKKKLPREQQYIITVPAVSALISITVHPLQPAAAETQREKVSVSILLPLVSLMATWTHLTVRAAVILPDLTFKKRFISPCSLECLSFLFSHYFICFFLLLSSIFSLYSISQTSSPMHWISAPRGLCLSP